MRGESEGKVTEWGKVMVGMVAERAGGEGRRGRDRPVVPGRCLHLHLRRRVGRGSQGRLE